MWLKQYHYLNLAQYEEKIIKCNEKVSNHSLIVVGRGKTLDEELDYLRKVIDDSKSSLKVCTEVISMLESQNLKQILTYAELNYSAQDAKQKALKFWRLKMVLLSLLSLMI